MTDGFVRKKVESLTLGEKLIKLRSQYRMSLADISKATRIQVKYLEALESGDHRGLPAEVYVRGFLRSYARYLGLEDEAFIKLYDKEKHIRTHLSEAHPGTSAHPHQSLVMNTVVVTPRAVILVAIAFVAVGTFWYLFRELRAFVAEPLLVVFTPTNGVSVSEASVVVSGRTDPGTRVKLNDGPVFVSEQGEFRESVTLQPGANVLAVAATNRFEKTKTVSVTVESTLTVVEAPEPLLLVFSSVGPLTRLQVETDGVVVWNGPWNAGQTESFMVRETVTIVTSNPQDTRLQVRTGEARLLDPLQKTETTFQYVRAELEEWNENRNTETP